MKALEALMIAALTASCAISDAKTVDDIQKSMSHLLAHEPKLLNVHAAKAGKQHQHNHD